MALKGEHIKDGHRITANSVRRSPALSLTQTQQVGSARLTSASCRDTLQPLHCFLYIHKADRMEVRR